ncbi:hypothetical protein [Nocardia barduliensis]|uniref:hypothetical protein n=1 Tax=Nocardia barduliensis TaxID=2736643 RepID=UPI00157248A6|nr:hypothetical protein [Nocardia barduliensis]
MAESRLSDDPADDPHGYLLIFGTLLATITAPVAAMMLPWAFPRHRRPRATITTATFGAVTVLLWAALLTS